MACRRHQTVAWRVGFLLGQGRCRRTRDGTSPPLDLDHHRLLDLGCSSHSTLLERRVEKIAFVSFALSESLALLVHVLLGVWLTFRQYLPSYDTRPER